MKAEREKFGAEELAIALSHYDLGIVHGTKEFPRGSRRAPKLIIDSAKGRFLLKRRAIGRDNLPKVAFAHQIQLYLAAQSFPLPHLLGTKGDNNSMLVMGGRIYEMFEYIAGEGYDGSLDATFNSGRILGLYHKLMKNFRGNYEPPVGSYHSTKAIHQAIGNTVSTLPPDACPPAEVVNETVRELEESYIACAQKANAMGLMEWETQIVHGDWHPGNMLFRDKQVVAVIDWDSARLQQRVIDFANGALQFSIIGGGEDPTQWSSHIDETRFKRFLLGYDSVNVITQAEIQAIPYLMCEAMIAEAVLPIAATGSFGRFEGFPFLQMIDRKVQWILKHLDELQQVLGE